MTHHTVVIILAAGSSSRLGKPKQNLIYQEQTLLQSSIHAALQCVANGVLVVLGANQDTILPVINSELITVVQNKNWEEGIASSIRAGLMSARQLFPDIEKVLFMLCDQPFVNTALLNLLIEKSLNIDSIVACTYGDTCGAPVVFPKLYFDELMLLTGQEGARKLIKQYQNKVVSIPFEKGAIDIDTMQDFQNLLMGSSSQ